MVFSFDLTDQNYNQPEADNERPYKEDVHPYRRV
jgi:hypothetical protein